DLRWPLRSAGTACPDLVPLRRTGALLITLVLVTDVPQRIEINLLASDLERLVIVVVPERLIAPHANVVRACLVDDHLRRVFPVGRHSAHATRPPSPIPSRASASSSRPRPSVA